MSVTRLSYALSAVIALLIAPSWASAQKCPGSAGQVCDSTGDKDLCKEGVYSCATGTPVCINEGPLIYLPMEEAKGTTVTNAAELPTGGDAIQQNLQWKEGYLKNTYGLDFSGNTTNQFVKVPANDAGSKAFTWALWVYPRDIGFKYFISRTTTSSSDGMAFATNGTLRLNAQSHKAPALKMNLWTHVAWTYNEGTIFIYYNGDKVYSGTQKTTLNWNSEIYLGQEQDEPNGGFEAIQSFNGRLDNVAYYPYAVDSTKVVGLATIGVPGSEMNRELCGSAGDDCNPDTVDPAGTPCDGDDTDFCKNGKVECTNFGLFTQCGAESVTNLTEVCNLVDDDCNGSTDEGLGVDVVCDGADPDSCKGGRKSCGYSDDVICGSEPILSYAFETNGGATTAVDSSSWHHSGVLASGASIVSGGKDKKGLTLDGIKGHVRPYDSTVLRDVITGKNTAQLTIATWIRPAASSAGALYYLNKGLYLHRNATGAITLTNQSAITGSVSHYGSTPEGQWSHIVATVRNKTVKIYINGVHKGTHQVTGAYSPPSTAVPFIGCRATNGWSCDGVYYKGSIDEFNIFNRALNATEITNLYSKGISWYTLSNEICNNSIDDDDCDGSNNDPGGVGCVTYYRDNDGDGYGAQSVLKLSPIAYWPMDQLDASGKILDWSGYQQSLSRWAGRRVVGKVGVGFQVEGRSYLSGLNTPSLAESRLDITGDLSAAAWINPASHNKASDGAVIVERQSVWSFGITTKGALRLQIGGSKVTTKNWVVPTGKWSHVAFVYSQKSVIFYKDGKAVQTLYGLEALVSKAAPVALGRSGLPADGTRRFDGILDEVVIFDKTLSASQVMSLSTANDHACLCAADSTFKATQRGDCDDNDKSLSPATAELCDGKDNNCNNVVDDISYAGCKPANATSQCSEGLYGCIDGTKVCTSKPFFHHRLDEASGNLVYNSAGLSRGGHGVQLTRASGKFGGGAQLNKGAMIITRRPPNAAAGGFAFWVKPAFDPAVMDMLFASTAKSDSEVNYSGNEVRVRSKGGQLELVAGGNALSVKAGFYVPQGLWTHIGVSWAKGGDSVLYVNGQRLKVGNIGVAEIGPYLNFGPGPSNASVGTFDDLVAYDYAPPGAVFQILATAGVPANQDTREVCDAKDNDCDGATDESHDSWSTGTTKKGQSCDTKDADVCKEGVWACDSASMDISCTDGPIGHFALEEKGTAAYDQAGDVPHGVLNGASQITGKSGKGIRLTESGSLTHGVGQFDLTRGTVGFWVRPLFDPTYFTGKRGLWAVGSAGDKGSLSITHVSPSTFQVQLGKDRALTKAPTGIFKKNQWTHVAVSWDRDDDYLRVFLNGTLFAQNGAVDWTQVTSKPTGSIRLGTAGSNGYWGEFDTYVLYGRALELTEVASLMNTGPSSASTNRELCDSKDNDCDGSKDEDFNLGGACDGPIDVDSCKEGIASCGGTFVGQCNRDGPVGYWAFDSGGAEVLDYGGAGLHGLALGGATAVQGKTSNGLSFNGSSSRVRLADFAPLSMTTGGITLAAWVNPKVKGTGVIIHKGGHYGLRVNSNGSVSYMNSANTCYDCVGEFGLSNAVPLDNWSHVAATWSGSLLVVYINGIAQGSKTLVGSLVDTAAIPYLGCDAGGSNGTDCTKHWFNGRLDDVAIYDYALTQVQVQKLAAGMPSVNRGAPLCGKDGNCDSQADNVGSLDCKTYWKDGDGDGFGVNLPASMGAVGYWPMDEADAATIKDISGTLNHGTAFNAPRRRAGKVGQALAFDSQATTSRVTGTDHASLDLSDALTITAWIKIAKMDVNDADKMIFHKSGAYRFFVSSSGKLAFQWPGAVPTVKAGPSVSSEWSFVTASWSKSSGKLVLSSWSTSGGLSSETYSGLKSSGTKSAGDWGIGQSSGTGTKDRFDGLIDDVSIFPKALSSAQIDSLRTAETYTCSCSANGLVTQAGDCDDSNKNINPGVPELCDGIDQNCNLLIDENADVACDDGKSCTTDSCVNYACQQVLQAKQCLIGGTCYAQNQFQPGKQCFGCNPDKSGTQWTQRLAGSFCDDNNNCTVNDVCDGAADCVGAPKNCDDNNPCTLDTCSDAKCFNTAQDKKVVDCYNGPAATKDVGECKTGKATCDGSKLSSCVGEVKPISELCDSKDNNCDGKTDETFNVGQICDGGDYDACKSGTMACNGIFTSRCINDGPVVWVPFESINNIVTPNLGWGGGNVFMASGAKSGAGNSGFGKGITLDGVNDHIQLSNFKDLQGSQTELSLAVWLKRTADKDHCFICKKGTGSKDEVYFGTLSGHIVLRRGNKTISSGIRLNLLNKWIHVAVVINATTVRFYVNGVRYSTQSNTGGATIVGTGTTWVSAAITNNSTATLAGQIDEIQIWKKALTDVQVNVEAQASRETCDGVDNNCDANNAIDEGFTKSNAACDGGDIDSCKNGTSVACHPTGAGTYCVGDGPANIYRMESIEKDWQSPSTNGPGRPLLLYGASTVTGKHGNGIKLDGVGFARTEEDAASLQPRALSGFHAVWVKFSADGDAAAISNSDPQGTVRLFLGRRSGVLHLNVMGKDASIATSKLPNNVWHHLAVSIDGKTAEAYVNAVKVATVTAAQSIVGHHGSAIILGGRWNGSNVVERLNGVLDEYRVYDADPGANIRGAMVALGEACNGKDDNCDSKGLADEGFEAKGQSCTGGTTCVKTGAYQCNAALTALECVGSFKPVGSSCDDGELCTHTDSCSADGGCAGTTYTCDSGPPNTVGSCNGDGTCTYTPEGGYCLINGSTYQPGAVDPTNPCKACQTAISKTEFSNRTDGTTCSDGNPCTSNDACKAGTCTGPATVCDDGKPCTVDSCDTKLGCVVNSTTLDGSTCDDNLPCTLDGTCSAGVCLAGSPKDCNDSNPCTFDGCNAAVGCFNTPTFYTEVCYTGPAGTAGVGLCKKGTATCKDGTLQPCVGEIKPVSELCDGKDNNCDATVDDGFENKGKACDGPDADECANGVYTCQADGKALECTGDSVQAEICDGLDNNCDGAIDETFPTLNQPCDSTDDADSCKEGIVRCNAEGGASCFSDGPSLLLLADDTGDVIYTAVDSSGSNNTAQLKGYVGFAPGKRGRAFSFDGVDDQVSVPTSATLKLGTSFTIAAYINWAGDTGSVSLIESKTGDCLDFALRMNSPAAGSSKKAAPFAVFEETACGLKSVAAGVPIDAGTWNHFAVTADGSKYRFYLNGKLKKTETQSAKPLQSSTIHIGSKQPGVASFYKGLMDEVGLWRYALTASQIEALLASGPPQANQNVEICDQLDNDCNGQTDEHKTAELCDGKDNNCDGTTDEGFADKAKSCDGGDVDVCARGVQVCNASGSALVCAGDAPLLWWRFETGNGTTAYDYAGTSHGAMTNGEWVSGSVGGGLRFSGAGKATLADGTGLALSSVAGLTLEARIKPAAGGGGLIKRGQGYELALTAALKPRCKVFGVGKSGEAVEVTGTALSTAKWHHLACVYDGGALRLYIDGKHSTATTDVTGVAPNKGSGAFEVGASLKGTIDEVALWDIALTETAIKTHSSVGIPKNSNITRDICDALDNDCDTAVDESFVAQLGNKCDSSDADTCKNGDYKCNAAGHMVCVNDVPDNGTELCNGVDDNCNDKVDENFPNKGLKCDGPDADQCKNGTFKCSADGKSLECVGDTPKTEVCNGLDDNCDGVIDEGFNVGSACDSGDLDVCKLGKLQCAADQTKSVCVGDGPVAFYIFDEGTGASVASSSGIAPTGSIKNAAKWVAGQGTSGNALQFSSKGDVVEVAAHDSLKVNKAFSMAAWARYETASGSSLAHVLTLSKLGAENHQLLVSANGKFECRVLGLASPKCAVTDNTLDMTKYHYFVCTYGNGKVQLYVDGALKKTCTPNGTPVSGDGSIVIGPHSGNPSSAITVDNVTVWNVALTALDVANWASGGDSCDGLDNNCDGVADEFFAEKGQACDGAEDEDKCKNGVYKCAGNKLSLSCVGDANKAEICDGLDNDCDDKVDEDFTLKGLDCDADKDGFANGTYTCTADGSGVECTGDTIGAEVCDGKDNDGDGVIDDNVPGTGVVCDGTDLDQCKDGVTYCDSDARKIICYEVGASLWLKLDETADSSTVGDSTPGKLKLKPVNATLGVAGKVSTSVQFATPGRLTDSANAYNGMNKVSAATFAAWVKRTGPFTSGASETIVAQWGSGGTVPKLFAFRIKKNGLELALRTQGDSGQLPQSYECIPAVQGCTLAVPSNQWAHVAAVYANSEVRLYLNGALKKVIRTVGSQTTTRETGDILTVGSDNAALANAFKGQLDDVVVYNRGLNALEISALVSNGPSGETPELCDGLDNTCDGVKDEGFTKTGVCDGSDYDLCKNGSKVCNGAKTQITCADTLAALHWPADETSGIWVAERSVNAADALLYGNSSFTQQGKAGGALKLVAADKSYGKGGNADVLANKNYATWVAWVKPSSVAAGRSVIVASHGAFKAQKDKTWAFGRENDGLFLRVRTTVDLGLTPATRSCHSSEGCKKSLLKQNQWTHVAAVFNVGNIDFYVDGALVASFKDLNGATINPKHANERLTLGATMDGELGYWDGLLDDVRVYNTALTKAEINRLIKTSQGLGLELCDGLDNDCNGQIDEAFPDLNKACDGPDVDSCKNGKWTCKSDKSGQECTNETVVGIKEKCNGIDDDCDNEIDEDFTAKGKACDGSDADSCKEGIYFCNADGSALECLRDGPTGLWRFDEGIGKKANDTSRNGSLKSFTLTGASWKTGFKGQAVRYPAGAMATSSVTVNGIATFELRIFVESTGYIYGQSSSKKMHFGGYWSNGNLSHYHDDNGKIRTMTASLSAGKWHHVVITMKPGDMISGLRLYVDGVKQAQAPLSINNGIGDVTLGKLNSSPQAFNGIVDELAIYNYILTQDAITTNFNSGIANINENRELCDNLDNDCNGEVDDGLTGKAGDACDGFDSDLCKNGTFTCTADKLNVECKNETVSKVELCDTKVNGDAVVWGTDEDCDGETDEGYLYDGQKVGNNCNPGGECSGGKVECITTSLAGCSTGKGGSSDETKPEFCDGKDNDCDGLTDEKPDGSAVTENCYTGPPNTVKVGICKYGQRQCVNGSFDSVCSGDIKPEPEDEKCDLVDEDCDGIFDEDYVDDIDCTVDTCIDGIPKSVPSDILCDDGNPCSKDVCVAANNTLGGCAYSVDDSVTPDQSKFSKSCKKAICKQGKVVLITADDVTPNDNKECTSDTCLNGLAIHTVLPGWCLIDDVCYKTGDINAEDGCKVCHPVFSTTKWSGLIHAADFDAGVKGNSEGYTFTELANGGVSWGVSPHRFVNKSYSLYFGNGSTKEYQSNTRVAAVAKSAPIVVPANITPRLTFSVWMETEGYTGSEKFDTLIVSIEDTSDNSVKQVWNSMEKLTSNTDGKFERVFIDAGDWAGKTIRIHFHFDSGDAYFNDYEGIYLDKIRLETACCNKSGDCNDNVTCSLDSCVAKRCVHSNICSDCVPRQASVVLLVDKSESMTANTNTGKSRWQETLDALQQVMSVYDYQLNLGVKLYPTSDATDQCKVTSGLDLDFHSSSEVLNTFLGQITPSGQTPMAAALTEAIVAYSSEAAKAEVGNKFVILLTDGLETCNGDVLLAVNTLRELGVNTILVAFDTADSVPTLTEIAMAGGLPIPRNKKEDKVYISATDATSVEAALIQAVDMTLVERCNGIDGNCDSFKDDNAPKIACNLACNSGVGGVQKCSGGKYLDCTEQVNTEICDSKDNDCDGQTDEEWPDLGKACVSGLGECTSTGKYICNATGMGLVSCDAPVIEPKQEVCDLKDNNCDGQTDEDIAVACDTKCGKGTLSCVNGKLTNCTAPPVQDEVCNGVDDDCNGVIDDIVPIPCSGPCGDGFVICANGKLGNCSTAGDPESCDGVDNDCDGAIDEDENDKTLPLKVPCTVEGQVGDCAIGAKLCTNATLGACETTKVLQDEICNGLDDDCNGKIDDTTVNGVPIVVSCYDGAEGTEGVGECKAGTRTCAEDGTLGECIGMVTAIDELCDGKDNNCDGATDENPGVICVLEPGCTQGACLCGKGDDGTYKCYLD